jgi:hypothetical protein
VTFVVMNNPEYNVLKSFMRSQPSYLSARSNRFIAMNIEQPPIEYLALQSTGSSVPRYRHRSRGWNHPAFNTMTSMARRTRQRASRPALRRSGTRPAMGR